MRGLRKRLSKSKDRIPDAKKGLGAPLPEMQKNSKANPNKGMHINLCSCKKRPGRDNPYHRQSIWDSSSGITVFQRLWPKAIFEQPLYRRCSNFHVNDKEQPPSYDFRGRKAKPRLYLCP